MKTPRILLAYAPRGVGLCCALAYLSDGNAVYGWFTGPAEGRTLSAFFVLEHFYAGRGTRFLATEGDDVHGGWRWDYTGRAHPVGPEPIAASLCHELVQLQDAFAHEWLVYPGDADAVEEREKYAQAELALGDVNIRFERLNRFSTLQPSWTFYSRDFERSVESYLASRWPLEYRAE